jgi:hypothetical protein
MNCAERLVGIFGTQADVARAFQLDRAVVHNWVKTGYVPARWAAASMAPATRWTVPGGRLRPPIRSRSTGCS